MPDFGKAAMYVMSFVPCILVSPGESAPCIYERLEAYNGLHRDMESPSKTGGSSRRCGGRRRSCGRPSGRWGHGHATDRLVLSAARIVESSRTKIRRSANLDIEIMIRVQFFDGAAGVRALAPAWRSLTAQLQSRRHFHHVEWHLALTETFERHNLVSLRCAAVFSDDNLVAVFPFRFMRMQLGPIQLNALRLASDHIDAATARDFVLAPGLAETGFFQGFAKYMVEYDASWDVMELPGYSRTRLLLKPSTIVRTCP